MDILDLSVEEIGELIDTAEDIIADFQTLVPFYHYFSKIVALTPQPERT